VFGKPVLNPDNVYENRLSVDILGDRDNIDVFSPQKNQKPGPSGSSTRNVAMSTPEAQMLQDGGAKLINILLSAAVSSAEAKEKIPDVTKVHKWHFRDLMCLPKVAQEE
jgi:hypothetical protein